MSRLTVEARDLLIEDQKHDIDRLKNEIDYLRGECARLQGMLNSNLYESSERVNEEKLSFREKGILADTQKLRAIIDNMGVGVGITDAEGNIISLNKAALQIHGYDSNEEFTTHSNSYFMEFELLTPDGMSVPPEDWPISRALRGDYVRDFEVKLINIKKSTSRYVSYNSFPLINSDGSLANFAFNITDLTENQELYDKLKANEAVMDAFFEASPGILNVFDYDLKYLKSDKLTPTYFGIDRSSIIGKSVNDLNPVFAKEFLQPLRDQVINTGQTVQDLIVEGPVPSRKNEMGFWSMSVFPLPLPGGKTGLGCVGVDITNTKKAEYDLARERELIQGIIDNIPVMIMVYDPEFKNFRLNKEIIKTLGWTEDDSKDGNFLEKLYPDPEYLQSVVEYMNSLTEGWKEFAITAKDKTIIESSWANVLLSSGVHIGIGINVSERKQNEKILRDNERRLQAIFNNAAIGIVEVDENDRFIFVNKRLCEMLHFTNEELLQKTVYDITAAEDLEFTRQQYEKLHRGETNSIGTEKRYVKKNGSKLWVHKYVSVIRDNNGNYLKSIGTVEDISERKVVEQALRQSEERLRLLADNISQIVWISDNQGIPIWFNKRWYDFTGVSLEEMKSASHTTVNHPEDSDRVFNSFRQAINMGEFWEDTFRMRNREGEYRWFLSRALPIKDESGRITLWFGTNTDITEQRKTEEALRNSEQRLQAIFNNAGVGIVEVNLKEEYIYVNNRICQMLGYTREELLGKSVESITAPHHRGMSHEMNSRLPKSEEQVISYEKQYIRKDGEYIWVHVSISSIRDEQGKHLRSTGIVDDISERVKFQQELAESEEKFRLLFENITEGVALHELVYENNKPVNYRLIDVNPAYKVNCGIQAEMAVGNLSTVVYGTDRPPYFDEFSNVAITRKPYRFETFFKHLNKYFIINVISPKIGQFATVFEDISDQKRNEHEIKQKNDELTRFIYTVSHDLKSPLVTIKSFTSYLKEDIENHDTEAQEKDIKYITNAADKMGRLLDELLELSRIGRKEESKEDLPLKTIANNAIDLVAGRISERGVRVEIVGPDTILHGDSQRLIQLYQNLIDNAVKFMGNQSEPLIEIGSRINPEKDNEIVMFVRDNGMGIDPRYHHKIFGLFEKLDNNTEGTGIGLALIKRIVEVHGGAIWFESDGSNNGTTFYFTMANTFIQHHGTSHS